MDDGFSRSRRVDRPSLVPPRPTGAEPNTREPRRFGRHSVEPLSTASSHTVASAYNPDIPRGGTGASATPQTRLLERRTSQETPDGQFRPEATVRFDLGGGLDNECRQELKNVAANSGRNENQLKDANEAIDKGFSFIGFIKEHIGKIAGVTIIATIGVFAGIFLPGVGQVIFTVCVVTIVGICTALIFSDGSVLIGPDKSSSSPTDSKAPDTASEPGDDGNDDDDTRSHSLSYSEAGTNPRPTESAPPRRSFGSQKGSTPTFKDNAPFKEGRVNLKKPEPEPEPEPEDVAGAEDELEFQRIGKNLKKFEPEDVAGAEDELEFQRIGKNLKKFEPEDVAGAEDELEFQRIGKNLKKFEPEDVAGAEDELEFQRIGKNLKKFEPEDVAGAEDELEFQRIGKNLKKFEPEDVAGAELEFQRIGKNLKKFEPEDVAGAEDELEFQRIGKNLKKFEPEDVAGAEDELEFQRIGKNLKKFEPEDVAGAEDELEFQRIGKNLKKFEPEDVAGAEDELEFQRIGKNLKKFEPEDVAGAEDELEFQRIGKNLKKFEPEDVAGAEDELEFQRIGKNLKKFEPEDVAGAEDELEFQRIGKNLKKFEPEDVAGAEDELEFQRIGKNLKKFEPEDVAGVEDELEFQRIGKALKKPESVATAEPEEELEFQRIDNELNIPDASSFGDERPFYSTEFSIDDQLNQLHELLGLAEGEQAVQHDSGYVSDGSIKDRKQETDILVESHSQRMDDSDYGSNYGDENEQNKEWQEHSAHLTQYHLGQSTQEEGHNKKVITRAENGEERKGAILTPFQMHIFKHGMESENFLDSLVGPFKDGSFLGQRKICEIARKELLARNESLIEADVDNWKKVWDALKSIEGK